MTSQMWICLAVFLFMIVGYCFAKKLNTTSGVVAFCTIVLIMFTGLVKPSEVIAKFGNSNVWLITGMYLVAAGFNRTQAVNKLSSLVYKISGGNFTIMMAGYCCITFLLTQVIPSPVAVFTLVAPLAAASCADFNVSPSKAMFPIFLVDVSTCGTLPIGAGATNFAVQNGYLESYGYTAYQFQMLDTFKGRFPVAIIILLFAIFIAPKFAPNEPSEAISFAAPNKKGSGKEKEPLPPFQEFMGYAVFIVTTILLIFSSKLDLENYQITMAAAAVLVVTKVLTPKEAVSNLPVRIVLMIVAALSAGGAMVSCGLGDLIGETIANAMGGTHNGYIIGAVFFLVPFLLTQVMQNQSVSHIFRPITILTCSALGCNPVGPLILLNAANLTAFMTPMATAGVPLMMGAGGYNQADLFKQSWLPTIIITAVSVVWIMTIFPAFP